MSKKNITNKEIAQIFEKMAELIEFKNTGNKSDPFRIRAYLNAAQSIKNYPNDIQDQYEKDELQKIPGLGDDTFAKVQEYLKTGKIKKYDELKKGIPDDLLDLMSVPGIGPKITKQFFEKLGIESIQDLRDMINQSPDKITSLERMGKKKLEQIKEGLQMYEFTQDRRALGMVYPLAMKLKNQIADFPEVQKAQVAGSIRRMKQDIGDLDILVISSKPEQTMQNFVNIDEVDKVIAKGKNKTSIFVQTYNIQVDIRVIHEQSWGAALAYFTGSKEHNIQLRTLAKSKGYKISEYGIYSEKDDKKLGGKEEKDIYDVLGLQYIPPEIRQNTGEIQKAKNNSLPKLIGYDDMRGDLHIHSDRSEGDMELETIAQKAIDKSYEYIGITDHSQSLVIANGLSPSKFKRRNKEIRKLQKKYDDKIKILIGTECDILSDGSLDYDEDILKTCDFVIASIHIKQKGDQTDRYLKVLDNPYVNIIGHPTGREFGIRPSMDADWQKIFKKAIKNNVAMEVNSQPSRLDLPDKYIKEFVGMGGKIVINTDAHSIKDLYQNMVYGIGQARRGWATAKDILNTWSYSSLIKFFGDKNK